MRKLTRKSLDELAQRMPVLSENVQSSFIGGGNGSWENPFTFGEYKDLGSLFTEGWVDLPDSISLLKHPYDYYFGDSGYDMLSFLGGSGYDGASGYWGGSGYDGASGYWDGESYDSYYSEGNPDANNLDELIALLPTSLWDKLEGKVYVRVDPKLGQPGKYKSGGRITISSLDLDALLGECVHAIQDFYGYGGTNHAAQEFQEHVIRDIYFMIYDKKNNTNTYGSSRTVMGNFTSNFDSWLGSCISDIGIGIVGIDIQKFKRGINKYISDFQKAYALTPEYQGNVPSNYNYDWEKMFRIIGISIVYHH